MAAAEPADPSWDEESAVFELVPPFLRVDGTNELEGSERSKSGNFDALAQPGRGNSHRLDGDEVLGASHGRAGEPRVAAPELATAPGPGDVGQLFSEYRAYVAKIGRRILGASTEVDDLIQDVFLATVKDVHKIKDPARLRAWLGTVTTRMAKRRRFRSSMHPICHNDDLDNLVDLASEEGPGPESTADLSGNIQKVLSLPDELRTPWLLKHVEGRTLQDVARQCDCSLSTAARRIQTASGRIQRHR